MNLSDDLSKLKEEYEKFKSSKKLLDLTRGRPSPEQLDLSDDLETVAFTETVVSSSFLQFRNCEMSSRDKRYLIEDFIINQKY